MNGSKQIFLIHSSKDLEAARVVKSFLEEHGFSCWLAPDDLPAGIPISRAITEAIVGCEQVVVLVSRHTHESEWVERESLFALDRMRKPAHVLLLNDSELPLFLIARHAIDIRGDRRTAGLHELLRDVTGTAKSCDGSWPWTPDHASFG